MRDSSLMTQLGFVLALCCALGLGGDCGTDAVSPPRLYHSTTHELFLSVDRDLIGLSDAAVFTVDSKETDCQNFSPGGPVSCTEGRWLQPGTRLEVTTTLGVLQPIDAFVAGGISEVLVGDDRLARGRLMSGGATGSAEIRARHGVFSNPVVVSIAAPPGTVSPRVILQDDFFAGTQWQATVAASAGGASHTAKTAPGSYRHMTHVFPAPGNIAVHHTYAGGSYTPSTQGRINVINYSERRIQFAPPFVGAAIGSRFLVIQNGVAYTAPIAGSSQFTNVVWELAEAPGLRPHDFTPAGLDFSSVGSEMTFGFVRSNSTGGTGITTTHAIDDWRVEIVPVQ